MVFLVNWTSIPPYQRYSLYLASMELSLGAIFHAARIPLTGYILSLHQAFCLSRAMRQEKRLLTPMTISMTVAILKTLSPAAKKITPMIAIIAQGFLFNMGILFLGNNMAGHMLGAFLLSLWGFIQPLLIITIVFGQNFVNALVHMEQLIKDYMPEISLFIIFAGIVCLKGILAMGAVLVARSSLSIEPWIQKKLSGCRVFSAQKQYQQRPFLLSLVKDLTGFWFLFSLIIMALFSWFRNDSVLQIFFMVTGYLAQAIVLILGFRLINFPYIINYLEHKGYDRVSSNLRAAFLSMNQRETS